MRPPRRRSAFCADLKAALRRKRLEGALLSFCRQTVRFGQTICLDATLALRGQLGVLLPDTAGLRGRSHGCFSLCLGGRRGDSCESRVEARLLVCGQVDQARRWATLVARCCGGGPDTAAKQRRSCNCGSDQSLANGVGHGMPP